MSAHSIEKSAVEDALVSQIDLLSFHEQHAGRLVIDPEYVHECSARLFNSYSPQEGEKRIRRGLCIKTEINKRWHEGFVAAAHRRLERSSECSIHLTSS